MWLSKAARFLTIIASPTARVLNSVASGVLAGMMVLTGIDVTLRYILNRPITGSYEITQFMMPIVIAFGLAYCALAKGHVRVDLVTSRLPKRPQAVMNSFACLVFLGLFILITWQSLLRAKGMIHTGLTSEVLLIPVFPFVLAVSAGSAVLCLVVLRDFFDYLSQALRK